MFLTLFWLTLPQQAALWLPQRNTWNPGDLRPNAIALLFFAPIYTKAAVLLKDTITKLLYETLWLQNYFGHHPRRVVLIFRITITLCVESKLSEWLFQFLRIRPDQLASRHFFCTEEDEINVPIARRAFRDNFLHWKSLQMEVLSEIKGKQLFKHGMDSKKVAS